MTESVLYAEIYAICSLFLGLIWFWSARRREKSAADFWLNRTYFCFLVNFLSNLLFTVFNRIWVVEALALPLSYLFKTAYLITLVFGAFCWCGFAETTLRSDFFTRKKTRYSLFALEFLFCGFILSNLLTRSIFYFDESLRYRRTGLFQVLLLCLTALCLFSSVRLLLRCRSESDPSRHSFFRVISSFPLCLLAALFLSRLGESFPVVCVCILTELFCIFVENSNQSVSTDTLTRVNNRQNLNRFMTYKLINHEEQVWLLMIDVDHFKPINDSFGHLEGDAALERISGILKSACQTLDSRPFIARYGGDEFVIVVEGAESETNRLCETIHAMLKESDKDGKPYQLRVSIGVAKRKSGMTYEQLVAEADARLYEVKESRPPFRGYAVPKA